MSSTKTFNKRYFQKLPVAVIIILILFAAALFAFASIQHEVIGEKEEAVDYAIIHFLSVNLVSERLTAIMKGITYFASAAFLQMAYAILVVIYMIRRNWRRIVEILLIGIGGFVVTYCMKIIFHRTRPLHPLIEPLQNFSFPSGHATSGFIFYGLLSYLVWKTTIAKSYKLITVILLILFSLLIGFSRIYLQLHYTTDVLAGFTIGFAWLMIMIAMMEWMKKKAAKNI